MAEIIKADAIESALIQGDLSKLTADERIQYYNRLCKSLGLNPLTKPFSYIVLNGKLTLYAARDCTDQLRSNRGVSVTDLTKEIEDDICIFTAKGKDVMGRCDAATGAVSIKGLTGESKANAMMKAETKAKRRLTLSLCGLGMVDESEVASIPGARVVDEKEIQTVINEKAENNGQQGNSTQPAGILRENTIKNYVSANLLNEEEMVKTLAKYKCETYRDLPKDVAEKIIEVGAKAEAKLNGGK